MTDQRITASLNRNVEELSSKIEFNRVNIAESKHDELKKEVKRFSL
jgi:hypothetical protein